MNFYDSFQLADSELVNKLHFSYFSHEIIKCNNYSLQELTILVPE